MDEVLLAPSPSPGARSPDELGGGSVVAKVRAGPFALYVLDHAS